MLSSILDKFPNGQSLYNSDPIFKSIVNTLAYTTNYTHQQAIVDLIEVINGMQSKMNDILLNQPKQMSVSDNYTSFLIEENQQLKLQIKQLNEKAFRINF